MTTRTKVFTPASWPAVATFAVVQALTVGLLLRAGAGTTSIVVALSTIFFAYTARRGVGLIALAAAVVVASGGVYGTEKLLGPESLSKWVLVLFLVVGCAVTAALVRNVTFDHTRLFDSELPAIVTAFVLVVRWPQRSPLEFLGLLKFEDNASWLGWASQFLGSKSTPIGTGFGGAVLESVLAAVSLSRSGMTGSGQLSDAYVVVGLTYQLLIFTAAAFAGIAIARLLPNSSGPKRALVAVGGTALAYVLLGLPLSVGHMTFIGALVFLWAFMTLPQDPSTRSISSSVLGGLVLVGAAGMWWPLIPVALAVPLAHEVQAPWARRLASRVWSSGKAILVGVGVGAAVVVVVAGKAIVDFLPLGFRDFFQVKGGLQPLPPNLLLLGLIGIALLFVWRETGTSRESWFLLMSAAASYTCLLALSAQFIGPDYAMNYSPSKLLLLFAILSAPFVLSLPLYLLRQHGGLAVIGVAACLVVAQGWSISSWSLNSPRVVAPPAWGSAVLSAVDADEATVLCYSPAAERRLEAYECTRHASSLTNFDPAASAAWRHMMLFPGPTNPDNDARIALIKDGVANETSKNRSVVLLLLSPELPMSEADSWWLSTIQFSREESVTP